MLGGVKCKYPPNIYDYDLLFELVCQEVNMCSGGMQTLRLLFFTGKRPFNFNRSSPRAVCHGCSQSLLKSSTTSAHYIKHDY